MQTLLPSLAPYLFGLFTGASSIGFLALVMHRRACELKGILLRGERGHSCPPPARVTGCQPAPAPVAPQKIASHYLGLTCGNVHAYPDSQITLLLSDSH